MNAAALNTVLNPAAAQPATAGTAATGGEGAVAGFEALISTLFPTKGGEAIKGGAKLGDTSETAAESAAGRTDDPLSTAVAADLPPAISDATAALLASFAAAAGQPAAAPSSPVPATSSSTGKAASAPSISLAFEPDTEVGAPADGAIGPQAKPLALTPDTPKLARPSAPPIVASAPTPSTGTPAPASEASANAADIAPPLPLPVDATGEASPTTVAATTLAAPLLVRQEPGAAAPQRLSRTERARAAADAAVKPTGAIRAEAPAEPTLIKAADASTTSLSPAVEGDEPGSGEIRHQAETPDGLATAESRSSALAATPTPVTTHAVRGSPETVANLAAQILKKLEGQSTHFDVELDPAGLGKVGVRIEIGANGGLTAAMTFDNPGAAAELKNRANELQRALEQAGFSLAGGLSFDVAGDRGQRQGQAWQDQDASGRDGLRGQAFRAALDTASGAADAATLGALRLRRGVNLGLDLRI